MVPRIDGMRFLIRLDEATEIDVRPQRLGVVMVQYLPAGS
jgi:hypothetical protein